MGIGDRGEGAGGKGRAEGKATREEGKEGLSGREKKWEIEQRDGERGEKTKKGLSGGEKEAGDGGMGSGKDVSEGDTRTKESMKENDRKGDGILRCACFIALGVT